MSFWRGFYSAEAVRALMGWIGDSLREAGGTIDDWRFCPDHPEATLPSCRRVSEWRKPGPGMILDLLRAWEINPARALMVGDQPTDLAAAAAAGVRGVRFPGGDLADFVGPLIGGSAH